MGVPSVSEWEARMAREPKPQRPHTDTQVPSYESSIPLSSTSVPSVAEWDARINGRGSTQSLQPQTQAPSITYYSRPSSSSGKVPSVAEWDARIVAGRGGLIHQPGESAKKFISAPERDARIADAARGGSLIHQPGDSAKRFISASEHEARIVNTAQATTVAPQAESSAPPPYSAAAPTTKIGASGNIGASGFPKDFGFYHASGGGTDMVIQLHADNSRPIFYVSCHGGFSSQPSVVLHSGPYNGSAPLATAQFKSFSSTIDIHVGQEPVILGKDGVFSAVEYFDFLIPSTGKKERFEWKGSSGPEVTALQGSSHGMKLVRAAKNEVVAAWARPNSGTRKKGKMRFMGDREALGPRFEVMAVISVLAIMEKRRRNNKRHNGAMAGGAGGFSGGGAGGMGGGC